MQVDLEVDTRNWTIALHVVVVGEGKACEASRLTDTRLTD